MPLSITLFLAGFALFVLASFGCLRASDVDWLIAARFGLGMLASAGAPDFLPVASPTDHAAVCQRMFRQHHERIPT